VPTSQRLAVREGGVLYFLLTDHLGSTSLTTNASGAVTAEVRYAPFGTDRYTTGTTPTSYRFTGQRKDATIGLYFYNSRYYDPLLGRFIQSDTLVPNPSVPQSLNRYAYTLNNPVRYTDPSGNKFVENNSGHLGCNTGAPIENCVYPNPDKPEPRR